MVWPMRDLAVAADGDQPALADGQDRGAVPEVGVLRGLHGRKISLWSHRCKTWDNGTQFQRCCQAVS